MSPWVWVPIQALYVVHDRQIARHGGGSGLRDAGLLEMGCARPINRAGYTEADVFDIAAAYAFGIAKAHAFVDGNKRTAFVAAFTFLRLNGAPRRPDSMTGVRMMEDLASGAVSEEAFAAWLRSL
ncbi:type II toxin-antitoxin system death-on-curing family toxin [Litorisediminicola beolgyonensis]|uniref:Type II toxin-antitoxin system death-on-curing family toxin n=1 Tax=Litorisediminicola beolgyonensis TaxID=1173614 RepID=A0ABW3ZLT4_9RHOB